MNTNASIPEHRVLTQIAPLISDRNRSRENTRKAHNIIVDACKASGSARDTLTDIILNLAFRTKFPEQHTLQIEIRENILKKSFDQAIRMMSENKTLHFHGPHHILDDTIPAMIILFASMNPIFMRGDQILSAFLANIFHDCVYSYDNAPGINELESAKAALKYITEIILSETNDETKKLIFNNKNHEHKGLFRDLDVNRTIPESIIATYPPLRRKIMEEQCFGVTIPGIMVDADIFVSLAETEEVGKEHTDQLIRELKENGKKTEKVTHANFARFIRIDTGGLISFPGKKFNF